MAGLLDAAIEHHRSIGALLMFGLSNSALALLRTLLETCYRLIWLGCCASDQQARGITNFSRRGFPDNSHITSDLVRKSKIPEFKTMLPSLNLLNDFTHSGSAHILGRLQRVKNKETGFERDAFNCVRHSNHLIFLAAQFFYVTHGDADHFEMMQREYAKLILPYEPPTPSQGAGSNASTKAKSPNES